MIFRSSYVVLCPVICQLLFVLESLQVCVSPVTRVLCCSVLANFQPRKGDLVLSLINELSPRFLLPLVLLYCPLP